MEHVVFYQSTQGTPAFRRMASIEDAVSFAEHLRNVEGVTDFSVYSLSPVSLKLRAYYHVEISEGRGQSRPAESQTMPDASRPPELPPSSELTQPVEVPQPPDLPAPAATDRYAIPPELPRTEEVAQPEASAPEPQAEASPAEEPAMAEPTSSSGIFATGPIATRPSMPDAFVKDDPAPVMPPDTTAGAAEPPAPIDPSVVDPTVEEVVPAVPTGRRSMGFFARS